MTELLTTKQVARAFGLSESTVKRWCDRGEIDSIRTTGGHRRLELVSIIEFVRTTGQTVVSPEMLGLPATTGQGQRTLDRAIEQMYRLLTAGDENGTRALFVDLHLAKFPVAVILDQLIAPVFERIGNNWANGELAIYVERRACEICLRGMHTLRDLIPRPSPDAPVALGGSPSGDGYALPTTCVELVFRSHGWNATSLGTNLPFETMMTAIEQQRPDVFWIAASHMVDGANLIHNLQRLSKHAADHRVRLVGGGTAAATLFSEITDVTWLKSMTELSSLASHFVSASLPSD